MIPEVLHFIWIDLGDAFPESYVRNLKLAKRNTNCRLVLHTNLDIQIPDVEISKIQPKYSKKELLTPVGQGLRVAHYTDILRLEILYEHGGIYSDLDIIWLKNPWHLLHHPLFIGFDNKAYKILCNAVIGSVARHPALNQYREWLESIWPPKKYWVPANPYKLWKERTDVVFLEKYEFFPLSYNKPIEKLTWEKSTAIHLYHSSGKTESHPLFELLDQYLQAS